MKNKIKSNDKEEEEEPTEVIQSEIKVGDLHIATFDGLKSCEKAVKRLLRDKAVSNYLNVSFPKKKMLAKLPFTE